MIVYARLIVFGPLALAALYLALGAGFSMRDRWAERQAGRFDGVHRPNYRP